MKNQKEIWKDIAGYDGLYKISSFGNVKSLKRNPEIFANDTDTFKNGVGSQWNHVSITNPLKD